MATKIKQFLSSPKVPIAMACLAVLLCIRSLGNGLIFDDYVQRESATGTTSFPVEDASLSGMFSFLDGNAARTRAFIELGHLPWWTLETLKIAFFRPLSEATHLLDYQLWPDTPVMMHAQSLAWFGLAVGLVAVLYRRMMGGVWVSGLAALLYAIDDAHGVPAGWIANRNALIALSFGILALILHDRWRQANAQWGRIAAITMLLMSLLSGESGIATGAYLLAYELFLVRGNLFEKFKSLLPYGVVTLGWWIAYHQMGFGTLGSGMYLDPAKEPGLFFAALAERLPLLLNAQWFWPGAQMHGLLPKDLADILVLFSWAMVVSIGVLLAPLLKQSPVARFWALGMVLCLLPVCAALPADRLLLFAGIGGMGLLAQLLGSRFDKTDGARPKTKWGNRITLVSVVILTFVHLIAAPRLFATTSVGMARFFEVCESTPVAKLPDEVAGKQLILVNPPISFCSLNLLRVRTEAGLPLPKSYRMLASGWVPYIDVTRADEYTLELQPSDGFITVFLDDIFRGPGFPMKVGQKVSSSDMTAEVLSLTEDQRPLRVRFRFQRSLEDPSMLICEWKDNAYVRFNLPLVGDTVRLNQAEIVF